LGEQGIKKWNRKNLKMEGIEKKYKFLGSNPRMFPKPDRIFYLPYPAFPHVW
jgi:hypothetical protein